VTLRLEASLDDIAAAIEGHTAFTRNASTTVKSAPPQRAFLDDMLRKYPDEKF